MVDAGCCLKMEWVSCDLALCINYSFFFNLLLIEHAPLHQK